MLPSDSIEQYLSVSPKTSHIKSFTPPNATKFHQDDRNCNINGIRETHRYNDMNGKNNNQYTNNGTSFDKDINSWLVHGAIKPQYYDD